LEERRKPSRGKILGTLLRAGRAEVKIMKFDHTVETTASPEKIWAAWTDVERWPQWDTELDSASLEGSFALGAKGRVKPKRGPEARFSISELISGESYTLEEVVLRALRRPPPVVVRQAQQAFPI
jgi:hypothetical protein